MMRNFAVLLLVCVCFSATPARGETYGNFETLGVIVDCPAGKTPADIQRVQAFLVEGGSRRPVQDLVQVADSSIYAGCLFFLKPDTEYVADVEFVARDGTVIARSTEKGRTRPDPKLPGEGEAVIVAPTGSDDNPGTVEKPLKTIKAGLARLSPGMRLAIRAGTYYAGELVVPSGAVGKAVVVSNYMGERVVVDAAEPGIVEGKFIEREGNSDESGKLHYAAAPFSGQTWNVTLEDKETGKYYRLYPVRTKKELDEHRSANKTFDQLGFTGAYWCEGTRIEILTPGKPVSAYRCHVSRFTHGLMLEGARNVFIDGIEFRHFGQNDCGCGVNVLNSSEVVVQNCSMFYCNSGVWMKGESSNNTIQDSRFVDDVNRWHFSYTKNREGWSYHNQVETGGVVVDANYTGRGLVFRRNRIDGMFDGSHLCPWEKIHPRTSETDWYDNTLIDIADDFVETDGFSRNVRIFSNYMDKSLSGVSLAQALDGPTWIIYNVIANSGVCVATTNPADYQYEGYPFKTNGGPNPRVGSGPIFFYQNTSWTSDPRGRAMLVKSDAKWRVITLRNNIWVSNAMGFDCWNPRPSLMEWDYDDVYSAKGPFFKMRDAADCATIADFQKRYGSLLHGISEDPVLSAPGRGDFELGKSSPCIDAGTVIPGINDGRIAGKAPDIGCYENGLEGVGPKMIVGPEAVGDSR